MISAVLTIAAGLVLSQVLSSAIAQRAREQAEWTATVTLRLGVQAQLSRTDLAEGFDPTRPAARPGHDPAHDRRGGPDRPLTSGEDAIGPIDPAPDTLEDPATLFLGASAVRRDGRGGGAAVLDQPDL